jgi:hypothetical protein
VARPREGGRQERAAASATKAHPDLRAWVWSHRKPTTIDEYLAGVGGAKRRALDALRELLETRRAETRVARPTAG